MAQSEVARQAPADRSGGKPMTTFTVTTAADRVDAGDGALSLREAVR
jgi:hypothetical protein